MPKEPAWVAMGYIGITDGEHGYSQIPLQAKDLQ
jgi:hypothetical protein